MTNKRQYKGDSKTLAVKVIDKKTSLPYDITGYTITLIFKKSKTHDNSQIVLQKEVTAHIDAVNGETAINLLPADTESLDTGRYVYEIKMSNGSIVRTIVVDTWELLDNLSN